GVVLREGVGPLERGQKRLLLRGSAPRRTSIERRGRGSTCSRTRLFGVRRWVAPLRARRFCSRSMGPTHRRTSIKESSRGVAPPRALRRRLRRRRSAVGRGQRTTAPPTVVEQRRDDRFRVAFGPPNVASVGGAALSDPFELNGEAF